MATVRLGGNANGSAGRLVRVVAPLVLAVAACGSSGAGTSTSSAASVDSIRPPTASATLGSPPAPTPPPGTFTKTGSTKATGDVAGQSAVLLSDGRVLVVDRIVGGDDGVETYDPDSGTFTLGPTMPDLPGDPVLLTDGRVFMPICGEGNSGGGLLYDPATEAFSTTPTSQQLPNCGATPVRLNDGRVLLISAGSEPAQLYDPTTNSFTPTGSMKIPRGFFNAVLLSDGRVLVAGGEDATTRHPTFASVEIYDPTSGSFALTGSMRSPREYATATALADGRVLIAGGFDGTNIIASAEVYDPATGRFTLAGQMGEARTDATAVRLLDGKVLVAGGSDTFGQTALDSAELYSPASETFAPTRPMTASRSFHTATLLQDGRVLLVGGAVSGNPPTSSAELYWP